jgi:two-component system NtrC family sensor kinase
MRRGAKPAKAKGEARPAGARTSPRSDASKRRQLEKRLAQALEQQTATAEILRVISSSPTDLQSVLDAVALRASRLCEAYDAAIFRVDGDVLRLVAHHGPIPVGAIGAYSVPVVRGTVGGRSVLERRTVHVEDLQAESDEFPVGSERARRYGFRTILSVPLVREGEAIGSIHIRRTTVQQFTESQIALLQTFGDQAVIAIENVRLFTELEARNRDLTEALEQQTATGEILRVIASSPTDLQPVLDTVARSAAELCEASDASVLRLHDESLRRVAKFGDIPPGAGEEGLPLNRDSVAGRALIDRRTIHVHDLAAEGAEFTPEGGRVGVSATAADGVIAISVSDTGVGIAPEDQEAIFEEFRQVGRDEARKQEGTGLGLTLAKKFVELHGGRITVRSQVGQGSTFTFTLPLRS